LLRNPAGNVYWAQNGRRWYVESQQVYNCLGGAAKTYYNVTDAQMNASYPEYGIGALAQCSSGKFANDRLYDCGSVNGSWVVDWWGWRKSVGSTTSYYSWKNHFTNLYGADGTRYDCTADFWAIRRASGTT
jgi:hypothetical protein